jgi:hypothetical protein
MSATVSCSDEDQLMAPTGKLHVLGMRSVHGAATPLCAGRAAAVHCNSGTVCNAQGGWGDAPL